MAHKIIITWTNGTSQPKPPPPPGGNCPPGTSFGPLATGGYGCRATTVTTKEPAGGPGPNQPLVGLGELLGLLAPCCESCAEAAAKKQRPKKITAGDLKLPPMLGTGKPGL